MNNKNTIAIEYYQDVIKDLIDNGQCASAQRVNEGMKRYVKELLK